ncbi:MAG: rRNA m(2)A-2503 methyltransferase [Oscillospiraceae bacterium]|nr:rRNA m(2)A-2503 methyltransferase [Oscillospiraceae bacterium]
MEKKDVKSLNLKELECEIIELGYPKFRAKQIYEWLHKKNVNEFNQMTNISYKIQEELDGYFYITSLKIIKRLVSKFDNTVKYLYELSDGNFIESVLMKYKHGNSVCVSTQVGCKMGCTFCASTKAGFVRNLTPSEILEQIYAAGRDDGEKVSNVVLMGIGEPLDNYDNVVKFMELLSDENGFNLSLRHLSLSTCGMVDKIYELANLKLGLTLSISLHAPTDYIRSKTMPINQKWKIEEVIKACKYYAEHTKRRISFEYALIDGVNDGPKQAEELSRLLKGMLCHVNLIPVNQVKETDYRSSDRKSIFAFQKYLSDKGINATVRRTLGADINAACGQLRREQS